MWPLYSFNASYWWDCSTFPSLNIDARCNTNWYSLRTTILDINSDLEFNRIDSWIF